MDKKISILTELIEHSAEANKLLLSNAIALENADIQKSQKYIKEATSLLSIMIKDVFKETKEIITQTNDESDYEFSILDLAKLLSKIIYNASCLIGCIIDNDSSAVKENVEKKLAKSINAATSLTLSILLN